MVGNNLTDKQLQEIVDKTILYADKDGDGKISFQEFCDVSVAVLYALASVEPLSLSLSLSLYLSLGPLLEPILYHAQYLEVVHDVMFAAPCGS